MYVLSLLGFVLGVADKGMEGEELLRKVVVGYGKEHV